jgi:hypothetical protein
MTTGERELLLNRLYESRLKLEELLSRIDPSKQIYPGWTIKQILAHISGWDDASKDALCAHGLTRSPSTPTIHSLDRYNEFSIASRKDMTYDQILKEWRLTRQALCEIIEQLPEETISEPIAVPWGSKTTLTKLVDIFSNHEKEHAQDILNWLKKPEKTLGKAGK